jgi:hypothetical protein
VPFSNGAIFSQEHGVTEGVQEYLGMESGIIYVLNIGMKHIDTNLKDWIGRYAMLCVLEVVGNSAKIGPNTPVSKENLPKL